MVTNNQETNNIYVPPVAPVWLAALNFGRLTTNMAVKVVLTVSVLLDPLCRLAKEERDESEQQKRVETDIEKESHF